MESNAISTRKYIFTYGSILGLISVAYGFMMYSTDNTISRNWVHTTLDITVRFGIIMYGVYKYKYANNGFLKLKSALKIGMGIVLISAIISIIWLVLEETILEPDLANRMMKTSRDGIIRRNPSITPEELHEQLAFSQMFNTIYFRITFDLIDKVIFGSIYVLIAGLILARKKDL
ncbi:DUF4199 domain-containing protein [Aquimarina macrocephali]|uniref:DUF4199 domain-containing protein n=1 Tax=Aquimarina macrocephali TaxID=666563 RepID=UPI00046676FD|nr:DUF4199 domain-containing protein [Aquimarina macrocephali]